MYGFLRHFVLTRVVGREECSEIASFTACCKIVDLILAAKRRTRDIETVAGELETAVATYIRLHKAAYGPDLMKPKFHWVMDLPKQLSRDRVVLECFIIERSHLLVKRIAEHCKNTSVFERTVLSGVVNLMHRRSSSVATFELLGPTAQVGNMIVADCMMTPFGQFAREDVVMLGESVGTVVACGRTRDGNLQVLVQPGHMIRNVTPHSGTYGLLDRLESWSPADVRDCLAWRVQSDDSMLIIRG